MQPDETWPQGNAGRGAGVGDGQREQRVTGQRFGPGVFAGIHVWLARKARGVDDQIGPPRLQIFKQQVESRVIHFPP